MVRKRKRDDDSSDQIEDHVDEAIKVWAGQYNDEFLARMKGDDATAYRLRAELKSWIMRAIRRDSESR